MLLPEAHRWNDSSDSFKRPSLRSNNGNRQAVANIIMMKKLDRL